MVQPVYTIEADPVRALLFLTMAGDWDLPVAERFAVDVAKATGAMLAAGVRHGELLTLIDMGGKNVVPQTVAARFSRMIRPGSPSKRIAMVVSGAMHRIQAKRVGNDPRVRWFDTRSGACDWLFGPEDA